MLRPVHRPPTRTSGRTQIESCRTCCAAPFINANATCSTGVSTSDRSTFDRSQDPDPVLQDLLRGTFPRIGCHPGNWTGHVATRLLNHWRSAALWVWSDPPFMAPREEAAAIYAALPALARCACSWVGCVLSRVLLLGSRCRSCRPGCICVPGSFSCSIFSVLSATRSRWFCASSATSCQGALPSCEHTNSLHWSHHKLHLKRR